MVMTGPLGGQTFYYCHPALQIGRDEDNHIALVGEQLVSGQHALIYYDNGQYMLVDQSVNGTWVNNERIVRHALRPGDHIQIWTSAFIFEPELALTPLEMVHTSPPEIGDIFNGYRLLALLGEGGMARVYKAETSPGHLVAVKIFLHANNKDLLKRFEEEARIGREILQGHPNIVRVIPTAPVHEGLPYLVMEYVTGVSLRDKLPLLQNNEQKTRQIILSCCNALHHAHAYNIVHRDIKPENILISQEGEVKVTDFGIAKVLGGISVTRKNQVIGTPEYLAPEQIKGLPISGMTDIYALGVVLYECLTGTVPFARRSYDLGANNEVMLRHLNELPVHPKLVNPNASESLSTIALKALAKDPKKRFPSAKAFADALGGAVIGFKTSISRRAPTAYLEVEGQRPVQRLSIVELPFIVGRNIIDESDLLMSRHHFQITWEGGRYLLSNLSRNGIYINHQRIYRPIYLEPNMSFRAGNYLFRFHVEAVAMRS
jgi:serine/threonine protein kinase